MTIDYARLIIWNPGAYGGAQIQEACVFILGSLDATFEDVDRACGLL